MAIAAGNGREHFHAAGWVGVTVGLYWVSWCPWGGEVGPSKKASQAQRVSNAAASK